jgi:hypothetical protein
LPPPTMPASQKLEQCAAVIDETFTGEDLLHWRENEGPKPISFPKRPTAKETFSRQTGETA